MEIIGNNLEDVLKGPVIHGSDAYYLVLPSGKFKKFYYISPEFDGFRVCQEKQNGTYRLINRFREISNSEYEYLTTMENGPSAAVEKDKEGAFYIFPNGENSKRFLNVEEFSDGHGLILIGNKKYSYLNLNNKKMSKNFYEADSFSCAHAKVRPKEDDLIHFMDLEGKIEKDSFANATGYFEGFATVQPEENGKKFKRDMLGNITENETTFGKKIYSYYNGDISLKNLVSNPDFAYDEKFKTFTIMFEKLKLKLKAYHDYLDENEINDEMKKKETELTECFKIYDKKSDAHFFR